MFVSKLAKSILAGMAISLAGVFYLSAENTLIGGALFSIGLLTIYLFDWYLYTGKCCYVVDNPKNNSLIVLISFFGNFIGAFLTATILRFSGLHILDTVQEVVKGKLSYSYLETFILGIFCGVMMCIAVLGYAKQKDDFGRFIIIFLPITTFIVAHFEHVIADMFYISLANAWSLKSVIFILICGAGNLVGCSIIPMLTKLTKHEKQH